MNYRKNLFLIILLSIYIYGTPLYSEHQDDIKISVKPVPGSKLAEFRCETTVYSSLGSVVSLFEDTGSMPEWVFRMKEARTIKRISDVEVIAYTLTSLPWPLEDRDSVLHTFISQDKKGVLTIEGRDYGEFFPLQPGRVRMSRIHSLWQFEPLPEGRLHVVFSGTGDPGGVIPLSVFNMLIKEAPYKTVKKFREVIGRRKYKGAVYPYIKEYPDGIYRN